MSSSGRAHSWDLFLTLTRGNNNSRFNKTETAVQSQDDAKNLYGRQNLNLIKKTENPLQDSARFCKILQVSASIHRSLSSCHTAKTARFCKIMQNYARLCKTLQDSAKFCKIRQDLARVCNHSQVIKQLPYCKKVEIRATIQQQYNTKQQTQELETPTRRLKI